MEIFDTHTHLNADDFAGREAEELALAKEMGVTRHNVVGFDAPTIKRAIELAEKYPEIYATIGWHPTEAGSYTQEIEDMIVANLSHPKVIGLGEIGLDYYWMEDPKDVQIEVFKRQIQLSKDHNLPFIVHTRDALEDILVETDAPYLAPVPKRGRENRTAYTRYVVDKIAELRALTSEEVAKATSDNAKRLFNCD